MTDTIDTRMRTPAKTPEIVELVERPAAVVHVDGDNGGVPRRDRRGVRPWRPRRSRAPVPRSPAHPFTRYVSFGERIEAEAGFPFAGTLVPTDAGQGRRRCPAAGP